MRLWGPGEGMGEDKCWLCVLLPPCPAEEEEEEGWDQCSGRAAILNCFLHSWKSL